MGRSFEENLVGLVFGDNNTPTGDEIEDINRSDRQLAEAGNDDD